MQGVEVLLTTYNTGGAILWGMFTVVCAIAAIITIIMGIKMRAVVEAITTIGFTLLCIFLMIACIAQSNVYRTEPYYTVRIDETASYLEFIEKYDIIKEVSDNVYEVREK